jgi:hypothetical protein
MEQLPVFLLKYCNSNNQISSLHNSQVLFLKSFFPFDSMDYTQRLLVPLSTRCWVLYDRSPLVRQLSWPL